ncbi:MAG: NAD(P)H-dependent oxidoreductase [Geminicoccaceae bacterium]
MRILVVHAHPVAESFSTALFRTVCETLSLRGHEVRPMDLYAIGFDPVMSRAERIAYHDRGTNAAPVADQLEALKWAEGLIFVYPTWWYSLPAMLKGWLDRVWVPHETFRMPEGNQPVTGLMTNIRLIGGVSTYGAPWLWTRWMGDPGRRIILRGIGAICARKRQTFWLALHKMDSVTPEQRAAFLAKVKATVSALPV